MPDLPPAEHLATPGTPTSRAEEARLAARLIRRRVTDPEGRAEVLAALGLGDVDPDTKEDA
jgi:predicted nucleotidyltransferase